MLSSREKRRDSYINFKKKKKKLLSWFLDWDITPWLSIKGMNIIV